MDLYINTGRTRMQHQKGADGILSGIATIRTDEYRKAKAAPPEIRLDEWTKIFSARPGRGSIMEGGFNYTQAQQYLDMDILLWKLWTNILQTILHGDRCGWCLVLVCAKRSDRLLNGIDAEGTSLRYGKKTTQTMDRDSQIGCPKSMRKSENHIFTT